MDAFRTVALAIAFIWCVITWQSASAGTPEEWKSRTIYQLLTDRFAVNNSEITGCKDIRQYCGGDFVGIVNQLDYIAGMGFDAIWISPIPAQTPPFDGVSGYHGYWQENLYRVNDHFGSHKDLLNLVSQCHKRGIWVMLDVVANHVGPVGDDYQNIVPFNQVSHYHNCTGCPSDCQIQDWNNQAEVEHCRLADLPDLAQENPFVTSTFVNWIHDTIANYSFDGIRIDTVPEVPKDFWVQYMKAAGVYAVGEVYNGDVNYVAGYQQPNGPLPGVLSYPLFFTLRNVFAQQNSMYELQDINTQYAASMGDLDLLGTFIDNHDQQRFLNVQSDLQLYKNAIVYTLMSVGIPIIYYGTEQEFNGGNDPYNREPLWPSKYDTSSELYQFISLVVNFRKQQQIWNSTQVQRYASDNFYAFTRGSVFVAMTNGGSNQNHVEVTITYHPYQNGEKLCNLFNPTTDCFVVENNQFDVYLENGECKIYSPVS